MDQPSRRQSFVERFQGVVMAVVMAGGFALAVMSLATPAARRQLDAASSLQAVVAGRTAAAVNYATAHYLPVDGLFRAAGGVARWRLFASGGPQVWVGRDDWLYLMDELRPWPYADAAMQARVATLKRVEASLHGRGIDLLVVLVPDKARVVGDMMDGPRSRQSMERYADFLGLLAAAHVPSVNLADAFAAASRDEPLYYRTDTHWNQDGAALAARTIAASISTPIDRSHKFATTADPATTAGPGDLLRLMSLDQVPEGLPIRLRPPIDMQHLEHTVQLDKAPAGGLLDDGPAVEVALIGSSYSVNANFAGRLQEALGAPVANFASAGGGFAGAAKAYFSGLAFGDQPPKLVIWEIPERVAGTVLSPDDKALSALFPGSAAQAQSAMK